MSKPGSSSDSRIRRRFALAIFAAILVLSCLPVFSSTAHADSRVWPAGYWGPLLSCTGNYIDPAATAGVSDEKTCTDVCDILHTGQNIIDFATTIVVFVGAPAMITLGGIMFMVSGTSGEQQMRSTAKSAIVSALIGVGITLGAYLILSTFLWLTGNGPESDIQVSWPEIRCEVPPPGTPAN